ncbi:hypothetical protein ABDA29_12930 [Bacillus pumilus]|uniref:hypothetical protein n=2 Tax=Bacillus pumilus TaxID=1408 RepID=UPI000ADF99DC|nr:hypothetical protein [Bacillus pumilus]
MVRGFTFFIFSMLFEELLLFSIRSISYVAQRWPMKCLALSSAGRISIVRSLNYLFKFKYMVGAIRKKAQYKKIHLHDMHHTHANMLLNQIGKMPGFNIKSVSQRLGHAEAITNLLQIR